MAYKDVEEKSKAATKVLLLAFDLSDKKGTHKGGGGARQGQGKSKAKRKKKDYKKTKELKVLYFRFLFMVVKLSKSTRI